MITIHKYELEVTDNQKISMPYDFEILSVQVQHGKPCLWARINTAKSEVKVEIIIKGTGHPHLPDDLVGDYIGTFQINDGDLVFHAFTIGNYNI